MDSTMMEGSSLEVLDLTHDGGSILTRTHTHDHSPVSRYDDAPRPHEHRQPTLKPEHRTPANLKKRNRSDSFLEEEVKPSSKKRKITGSRNIPTTPTKASTQKTPPSSASTSNRGFKAPSTPPPTSRSRAQHKKQLRAATKAPRAPSRYVLAARAAELSSSPPSNYAILSDKSPSPRTAAPTSRKPHKPTFSPMTHTSFWDDDDALPNLNADLVRSQQAFQTALHTFAADPRTILPSTEMEIPHRRSSDEGFFLPPSPYQPPTSTTPTLNFPALTHSTGTPTLPPQSFHTLQQTHAKQSFDALPQLPHHFTHPLNPATLSNALLGLPDILQRFEQRWEEQFRDVREEIDGLAEYIDEFRGSVQAGEGVGLGI